MRSFLSLSFLSHGAGRTRVENIRTHRKNFGTCFSIPSKWEARFVPHERAFSGVYVLVLHIEHVCLLKTTTTTPYVCAHIYEESTGDVARLRGVQKAERSEESALFKLLSGCFCFVFFSLVRCCCRSHLSLRSTTTTPYVLHLRSVARILQS